MKFWIPAKVVFVVVVYTLTLPAVWGQNAARQSAGQTGRQSAGQSGNVAVAVIDIQRVFEAHPGFKQKMESINADLTAFKNQSAELRKQIASQKNRLNQFVVGSPEYKQADAEVTRQISELQIREQLKKKDLLLAEANIYFETYKEVQREVAAIAVHYRIPLVIRFDSKPIDAANRASVLKGVNRAVIYQKDLDITDMVLEAINVRHNAVGRR